MFQLCLSLSLSLSLFLSLIFMSFSKVAYGNCKIHLARLQLKTWDIFGCKLYYASITVKYNVYKIMRHELSTKF